MGNTVVCELLRTPIGRYGGTLRDVPARSLAATAIRSLVDRTSVGPEDVDDIVISNCYPNAEATALGHVAELDAGLSIAGPGSRSTGVTAPGSRQSFTGSSYLRWV